MMTTRAVWQPAIQSCKLAPFISYVERWIFILSLSVMERSQHWCFINIQFQIKKAMREIAADMLLVAAKPKFSIRYMFCFLLLFFIFVSPCSLLTLFGVLRFSITPFLMAWCASEVPWPVENAVDKFDYSTFAKMEQHLPGNTEIRHSTPSL